jgi:hypothetical protein
MYVLGSGENCRTTVRDFFRAFSPQVFLLQRDVVPLLLLLPPPCTQSIDGESCAREISSPTVSVSEFFVAHCVRIRFFAHCVRPRLFYHCVRPRLFLPLCMPQTFFPVCRSQTLFAHLVLLSFFLPLCRPLCRSPTFSPTVSVSDFCRFREIEFSVDDAIVQLANSSVLA